MAFRPNESPLPILIFTDSDGKQWGSTNGLLTKDATSDAVKKALADKKKAAEAPPQPPPPDQKTTKKSDNKKTTKKK